MTRACANCHRTRRHHAFGLCATCYCAVSRARRRAINPPPPPSSPLWLVRRDELLDDWVFLRDQGYTWRNAAPRLGVTPQALDQALARAKRRGDPRGERQAFGRVAS